MPSSLRLLASLGLLLVADSSLAFVVPTATKPSSFGVVSKKSNNNRRTSLLQATIYAAPDEYSSEPTTSVSRANSWLYEDAKEDYSQTLSPAAFELAASISQHQLQQLARLAVAFSPANRQLQLDQINNVSVLSLSESQIELEVSVCEINDCVTLAVPINYPHQCSTVEDHDCVLSNIQTLDLQAATTIQQQQQRETLVNSDGYQQLQAQLHQKPISYPSWWVHSSSPLSSVCDSMKNIVNRDEFQPELVELAKKQTGSFNTIQQAVVVDVCPTGMCLRALDSQQRLSDISIPFSQPATDEESLKGLVLSTIESGTTENSATCEIDAEMLCELTSTDNLNLPAWWTPSLDMTTSCHDICDNMKRILNSDAFHAQVKSLVVQELNQKETSTDYVVEKAHVVSICPTGMYIRAIAKPVEILGEDLPLRVLAVTLQFDHKVVTSEELHSAVLGCVAAASMYAE